jgi:hypothetical protein
VESLNISQINIISVQVAKVLWYISRASSFLIYFLIKLVIHGGPEWTSTHQFHHEGWMDGWMDDKLSRNSFLLASSSLANRCGYLSCFFFPTYLLTTHKQVVSMYVLKKAVAYVLTIYSPNGHLFLYPTIYT